VEIPIVLFERPKETVAPEPPKVKGKEKASGRSEKGAGSMVGPSTKPVLKGFVRASAQSETPTKPAGDKSAGGIFGTVKDSPSSLYGSGAASTCPFVYPGTTGLMRKMAGKSDVCGSVLQYHKLDDLTVCKEGGRKHYSRTGR